MTRAEHLEWAKQRAEEYLQKGDTVQAYTSFVSDQGKHDELKYDPFLLSMGMNPTYISSVSLMREFIQGFN